MQPKTPGELTITAQSGDLTTVHTMAVKPSVPRPVIFWDFTDPRVTDKGTFSSSFTLSEDLTQRANRAVARIDLPGDDAVVPEGQEILKVFSLPGADRLNKSNIRGVIFDLMTSPDFACDDPDASIMVVMQSPANWWMHLGDVPLRDAKQWKTHQLDVKVQDHIKAMPTAGNIIFILNAGKPAKGSIYLDRIGLLVR